MAIETADSRLATALRTVAVNGAYDASRALSKWFRRGVRLTSDGFRSVPISQASSIVGEPDEDIVGIHLPLTGELSGDILLTFPKSVALLLVDIMMQQPEGTCTTFGELEQSCLQETGNIVGSAYANSLAKWLKLSAEPNVPVFAYDMASAIVDPLLMEAAATSDEVLIAQTDFLLDGQRLQWEMLLLPSAASLSRMEQRCQDETVRMRALRTIAINGAFNASRAVSKWLKKGVKISTEGFTRVPLAEVSAQFDQNVPIVAMHFPLGAQLCGHALLAVTQAHARQLVDLLMDQTEGTTTTLGEIEQSALLETGNIVSSSFVNSWSNWLELRVEPGAPSFVVDFPGAVMQSVITEQALAGDEVYLAKTDFVVNDRWLEWVFLLFPAPSAMRLIESSCE